jgi:hypothetical protein
MGLCMKHLAAAAGAAAGERMQQATQQTVKHTREAKKRACFVHQMRYGRSQHAGRWPCLLACGRYPGLMRHLAASMPSAAAAGTAAGESMQQAMRQPPSNNRNG